MGVLLLDERSEALRLSSVLTKSKPFAMTAACGLTAGSTCVSTLRYVFMPSGSLRSAFGSFEANDKLTLGSLSRVDMFLGP